MIPLVIASGAGAAGRRAVGTGVMGGMLSATFLGIFFIPLVLPRGAALADQAPPAVPA